MNNCAHHAEKKIKYISTRIKVQSVYHEQTVLHSNCPITIPIRLTRKVTHIAQYSVIITVLLKAVFQNKRKRLLTCDRSEPRNAG